MAVVDDPYIAHVQEMLAAFGLVSARRMFGGFGIYRGAVMFALVADDVLYFKSGPALAEVAAEYELKFFTYEKPAARGQKKVVVMSYAEVPADVLEDIDTMAHWAEAAYIDALGARRGKPQMKVSKKRAVMRRRR